MAGPAGAGEGPITSRVCKSVPGLQCVGGGFSIEDCGGKPEAGVVVRQRVVGVPGGERLCRSPPEFFVALMWTRPVREWARA